jgi:glucuronoarabinoxylan endo-1,4-beta-xylanase
LHGESYCSKGSGLKEALFGKEWCIMRCVRCWLLLRLVLICSGTALSLRAGVTVIQNVAPGATSWPGSPTIITMLNPSSATVPQTFTNSGSGFTTIGQTFTVTSTNYVLKSIEIYAGGGVGTSAGVSLTLNLFDLGNQAAPNPTPYSRSAYKDIIGGNLFGSGVGLQITYGNQVNGILEFDFTGADQALLQAGHMYVFELQTSVRTNVINWLSVTIGNPYAGGAAYTNKYWLNASSSCDFSMAVYGTATATIPSPPIPQLGLCTVNWNDVRQRIDGFGASSAFRGTGFTTAQADMLFSTNTGIGLSLLRNQVQAGGFASLAEIGIMQQAIARGARVWSTPWSPQASFKTPQIANGGNFDSANNQAYANQLASYVVTMKNQGIDLYALSVQNEPDITNSTYATCWWTAQQISNFVPYLHDALVASNVASTRIMISESFQWQNHATLYTTAMNDPSIAAMVGVIADHNYDGIPPDPATGTPAAITNYGKALWETEVATLDPSGSTDSSMQDGIYWAGRIHAFLTVAQANAWHFWWLIYGNSTPNQGLTDISSSVLAKRGYVLGNYSRFVRPNYYRIGVAEEGGAMVSAFRATNSSAFAIVAINSSPTNAVNQTFDLSNFTASSVIPWVTSGTLSLSSQAAVAVSNSSFFYVLPPLSVVTFIGQASPPTLTATQQGESLVLSWPTNASDFGLEYSTSVSGGTWTPFPAMPTVVGNSFVVTSGLSNDAGFFRLHKP